MLCVCHYPMPVSPLHFLDQPALLQAPACTNVRPKTQICILHVHVLDVFPRFVGTLTLGQVPLTGTGSDIKPEISADGSITSGAQQMDLQVNNQQQRQTLPPSIDLLNLTNRKSCMQPQVYPPEDIIYVIHRLYVSCN